MHQTDPATSDRDPRGRAPFVHDLLLSAALMFPAAAIVALFYRFPLPTAGPARGPAGVWPAMLAALVYGLGGGFLVVPALGAGLGALLRRTRGRRPLRAGLRFLPPAIAAATFALVLAILG